MLGLAPTATTGDIANKWRDLFLLIDPEKTNDQGLKGRAEDALRIVNWAKLFTNPARGQERAEQASRM